MENLGGQVRSIGEIKIIDIKTKFVGYGRVQNLQSLRNGTA